MKKLYRIFSKSLMLVVFCVSVHQCKCPSQNDYLTRKQPGYITNLNVSLITNPNGMVPVMGDDDKFHLFRLEKGDDSMCAIMYSTNSGGLDFGLPRQIYCLDINIGEWVYVDVTRDIKGNYHFFYLNFDGDIDDDRINRGESERLHGDEYGGLKLNIWYNKCNAAFEDFTKPRKLTDGYIGSLNSCLTLKNGRILLPFSYYVNRTWRNRDPQLPQFSHYGVFNCVVLYSDDFGESFSLSNSLWIQTPDIVSAYGAVEPVCFEKNDGSVDMFIRTQNGVFYHSESKDGSYYETPKPTSIINSDSPAAITKSGKKTILLYNSCKRYPYAYGGRHVLHAAISDDDLLHIRGGREIFRDERNYEPPPKGGDYGTAYPFANTLNDGRVIFATGQGDRFSIGIIDPAWLEQTSHTADFVNHADEWHHFGIDNITVNSSGVTIRPSQDAYEAVVWNYPALFTGRILLEFETSGLFEPVTLLLTDHFSTPFDEADWLDCVFEVPVQLANGSSKIELNFNCETGLLDVSCNGKSQTKNLRAWKRPRNGVNYLRVKTPRFVNENGYVKLTSAYTDEL